MKLKLLEEVVFRRKRSIKSFLSTENELKDFKTILNVVLTFALYVVISKYMNFKGAHYIKSLMLAFWASFMFITLAFLETERNKSPGKLVLLLSDLGEKSYSLYEVHISLLVIIPLFVQRIPLENLWIQQFLIIIIAFLLVHIIYKTIENKL